MPFERLSPVRSLPSYRGQPFPLMKGAETVGDPIAVLPTLFHLLWSRRLDVDLAVRLDSSSIVRTAS
ncbi:hypothetical protein ACH4OY_19035 [Micromonospora rubida]|uniref:Uncharacterized protein n=1 Tax=Micromonospora rubida TaxID=2697657 RepID=A0ABW7SM36_9ACTN